MRTSATPYEAQPEFALNVCDLPCTPRTHAAFEQAALFALSQSGAAGVERVCVGSYFCDRLFLSLGDDVFEALASFCSTWSMRATLVVPIFPQRTWMQGARRVAELLENDALPFDEMTVNDYATAERLAPLCRARGLAMNWGRLFAKALRDPRHADFAAEPRSCEIDAEAVADLRERYPLGLVELDPFAPAIDCSPLAGAPFALHLPHCFATTGHICEAASTARPASESFRADAACGHECTRSFTLSLDEPSGSWFVKHGRTVYFENPGCTTTGARPARILWSAADFRGSTGGEGDDPAAAPAATPAAAEPAPAESQVPPWE